MINKLHHERVADGDESVNRIVKNDLAFQGNDIGCYFCVANYVILFLKLFMTKPLRISTVSYLNAKPFAFGLQNFSFSFPAELMFDVPSVISGKLLAGQVDIGLAPVITLLHDDRLETITPFCIGADGKVGSVVLLSDKPLNETRRIALCSESQTSNFLLKLLVNKYWKLDAEFIDSPGSGTDTQLLIGDKAMKEKENFRYTFDLSEEWKKFTGLPFVFALWISNRKLNPVEADEFENAVQLGVHSLEKVIALENGKSATDVRHYLTHKIIYRLDEKMKAGLDLFLRMAKEYEANLAVV